MSAKYSNTTADYLEWSQAMNLVRNLYNDGNYRISLLIACGSFWGLRISDILSLKWKQVYGHDEFELIENKTKKVREIKINPQLKQHITDCYDNIQPKSDDEPESETNRKPSPPEVVSAAVYDALFSAQPKLRYLVGTKWEGDRVINALIEKLLDENDNPQHNYSRDELVEFLDKHIQKRESKKIIVR